MYNTELPTRAELPSSRQLIRSTLIAAVAAGVLLTTAVLPAEYGMDPTGIGSVFRLTEMGKIKNKLAVEAAADAAAAKTEKAAIPASPQDANAGTRNATVAAAVAPTAAAVGAAAPQAQWRDAIPLTLKPGEGTEVKLKMTEGAKAQYAWVVEAGEVNYDTHGDGGGRSISYQKGRGASSDEGVLTAAFTGNHGWFWRNRGASDVKLILRTRGEYTDIKKVM
ncbi:hypothetical protein [Cupriavidus metallidurans]|uniref:hypothetical protein n=1 Tax=Cupriavidus metallidurans TaxID=119219 RepID=UPI000493359D|nr:hypothetical protein [Cupriavidus metallidurans]